MKCNNIFIYIFLIIVIFSFAFYNSQFKEHFTPFIRKYYRPHMRNLRIYKENMVDKIYTQTNSFLKRNQLY